MHSPGVVLINLFQYYVLFRDGNKYLQAQGTQLSVQQHDKYVFS